MRLPYKIVTIVLFFVASYIFLNSGGAIVEGLVEQQKVDASYGKDYVRILSAKYYLTQFTPNTISKIFGNGFSNNNSNYGKTLIALNEKYGYYLSDVGLVEVYISCGVFAIFGFLMIFIKSIFIPLPKEYYYLKYYLWMVMITSLTSNALISYNFIVSTVLVLYSYQRIIEYKLEGKVLKNHSSSISSHNSIFRH